MSQTPFRPRPAGELALLSHQHLTQDLVRCREHVFRVHDPEPVKDHECESGYLQRADCLVCGTTTSRMDATWWLKPPTPEALAASIRTLEAGGRDASELRKRAETTPASPLPARATR